MSVPINKNQQTFQQLSQILKTDVIIDGNLQLQYNLCPECKPSVGDKIIAKVTKTDIKIHTMSCKALETVSFDKILEAHFVHQNPSLYHLTLTFELIHKQGVLMKLLDIYHRLNINILDFNFVNTNDICAQGSISTELSNPSKIAFLLKECKKYDYEIKITKKIFS